MRNVLIKWWLSGRGAAYEPVCFVKKSLLFPIVTGIRRVSGLMSWIAETVVAQHHHSSCCVQVFFPKLRVLRPLREYFAPKRHGRTDFPDSLGRKRPVLSRGLFRVSFCRTNRAVAPALIVAKNPRKLPTILLSCNLRGSLNRLLQDTEVHMVNICRGRSHE